MLVKYPSRNAMEQVVYKSLEIREEVCAEAIYMRDIAQTITYGIQLVRDLERNHGLKWCMEDSDTFWSPV